MFSTLVSILLALSAVALVLHGLGVWSAGRVLQSRHRARPRGELPGVTLLKPIKGMEEELEGNLRSFYSQDYAGERQYILCSTDRDDPGIAVARRVAAEFPEVETRFVCSRDDFGHNPKVSNMSGGLELARHDLLLQSDANVRVRPDYLRSIVGELLDRDASLLGSLVVGVGERSAGAALENLQLTGFIAPSVCIAREIAHVTCVLGKAMLLRRSELDQLGGIAIVKDVLCEDFVLAQRYAEAGKRVVLSAHTVENVNVNTPVEAFVARHSRWLKMRAVLSLPGTLADLGANPLPFILAASILDARLWLLCIAVWLHKSYWDAALLRRLRGDSLGLTHLWAGPVRDVMLALICFYSLVSRSTEWRGKRFLLGPGSTLIPDEGPLTERLARRVRLRVR
ncbi:MAG: glycosyltransferase [Myxococcales bacterium]|nr:glycosyltransferase [Myxococcales bacterium]